MLASPDGATATASSSERPSARSTPGGMRDWAVRGAGAMRCPACHQDQRPSARFCEQCGARLEAAWLHDWQEDPCARGAYSYVTVGGGRARRALAAPLRDTLFFAGEATDYEGEHGTVAGALRSGVRAARELVKRDR